MALFSENVKKYSEKLEDCLHYKSYSTRHFTHYLPLSMTTRSSSWVNYVHWVDWNLKMAKNRFPTLVAVLLTAEMISITLTDLQFIYLMSHNLGVLLGFMNSFTVVRGILQSDGDHRNSITYFLNSRGSPSPYGKMGEEIDCDLPRFHDIPKI